jgi:hypothetical protein
MSGELYLRRRNYDRTSRALAPDSPAIGIEREPRGLTEIRRRARQVILSLTEQRIESHASTRESALRPQGRAGPNHPSLIIGG